MTENNVPLVFDPEIQELIEQPAPITGKYWPDIRKKIIRKEANLLEKSLIKIFGCDLLKKIYRVEISYKEDIAHATLFKFHLFPSKLHEFEKKPIIPRESQDSFEAVYNKVEKEE